jgi:hypothetical protein
MNHANLWVFGSSLCLPFNLGNKTEGWVKILSNKLDFNCINLAEPGADNFFIYQCYLNHKKNIKNNDLLIIAWSHYSRKSFELDQTNLQQQAVLDNSLIYQTGSRKFIRNNNTTVNHDCQSWLTMTPKKTDLLYYNNWFDNYYSEYEQKCNFQSYLDSVRLRNTCKYLPIYFSKESVTEVGIPESTNAEFIVDYILENNLCISDTDAHLNDVGHQLWANYLYDKINLN